MYGQGSVLHIASGKGQGVYDCAEPPDLGAPVSPPAIVRAVVVSVRLVGFRALRMLGLRVWMMVWRSMVDGRLDREEIVN